MTQHILITGATSGIGYAIACHAAQKGLALTITGIESPNEGAEIVSHLTSLGASYGAYYQLDASEGQKVREVIGEASNAYGSLAILVNNAGIQHVAPLETFDSAAWDKVIAVNLSAAFHTTAAALPFMRDNDFGRIINIASVHGLVASAQKAAYVAAKHGIIGLTKTIALETSKENITCNAICPGWVRTPLVEAQIEQRAAQAGRSIEEEARLLVAEKQPSETFVQPDDIAEMVMFLTRDHARTITGSSFVMDGGWTAQ